MSTIEEQIAALHAIADKAEEELEQNSARRAEEPRHVRLDDILTKDQVREALRMFGLQRTPDGRVQRQGPKKTPEGFAAHALKWIEPRMEEINKALGQENDARYLAYAVEYIMGQMYDRAHKAR